MIIDKHFYCRKINYFNILIYEINKQFGRHSFDKTQNELKRKNR